METLKLERYEELDVYKIILITTNSAISVDALRNLSASELDIAFRATFQDLNKNRNLQ